MTRSDTFTRILRGRGPRADQPGSRFSSHHSAAFQGWVHAPRLTGHQH